LIGTALVVIIPEGMHMWLAAASSAHDHEPTEAASSSHHHEEAEHDHGHQEHWQIGASMAAGFAFMLLVDKLSGGHGHAHSSAASELPATTTRYCATMSLALLHRHTTLAQLHRSQVYAVVQ
jgi:ABC-type nickel/cobalt efflux system permease component RcnA